MTESEQSANRREGSPVTPAVGWPLAWRLLVPLSLVAALFCGALSYLLIHTVSSTMDRTVDVRLGDLAQALARGGFALDDELLARVNAVTDAELAVLAPDGTALASTLSPEEFAGLSGHIATSEAAADVVLGGQRHRLISRPLGGPGDAPLPTLVVAGSTRSSDLLKRRQARIIVLASSAGLLLLLVVGHLLVNSATRPLARLAAAAREAGAGKLESRVPGGGGKEIATLATEFNSMLGELIQSREELVRAEKLAAAGSMAATVAHEIRNPLSSIRMNIQLLEQRAGEQLEMRRELKEVVEEVDRLDLVLSNLLDLTVPARLHATDQDLNEVVVAALRLTSRKLTHLGVNVETTLQRNLPAIRIDGHKARQAFLNVILNAVDAMPGGGRLCVTTAARQGRVLVVFEDSGPGVDPAVADKIFDPFFSTKTEGVGLGLHTVRNVMQLHDGEVRFEAASPAGTRCVLEFPAPADAARPTANVRRMA